jgi:hypothetical protein
MEQRGDVFVDLDREIGPRSCVICTTQPRPSSPKCPAHPFDVKDAQSTKISWAADVLPSNNAATTAVVPPIGPEEGPLAFDNGILDELGNIGGEHDMDGGCSKHRFDKH